MFVDAPPTGAPAGRFDKLEPSPLNDVAVNTPVTIAPACVVSNFFTSLKNNSACASAKNLAVFEALAIFPIST